MSQADRLGFIGLGSMGSAMCRRLLDAGQALTVYDLRPDAVQALARQGAAAAGDVAELVAASDLVLTSLRSSAIWVEVAEDQILPAVRPGQVVIDLGTVTPPETRRLSDAFSAAGASLVDAPVSGGAGGAAAGTLHIFVGGDDAAVARAVPVLRHLGNPERIVHCGLAGAGQVVKGVNQLGMGLSVAAMAEAVAFGVGAGVDPAAIRQAVGGPEPFRQIIEAICRLVETGHAHPLDTKRPELPYFLREVRGSGRPLPLTEALVAFLADAPESYVDNMGRPQPSLWAKLMDEESA